MKRPDLFARPLIPFLLSFAGGIVVAHTLLPDAPWLRLSAFMGVAAFLLLCLFTSNRIRIVCLIVSFVFTGILLDMGRHRLSDLIPLALKNRKVTLEGTVLEPIQVKTEVARVVIQIHRLFVKEQALSMDEKILVTVYNHLPPLNPGDKIRFPAKLTSFKNFNNPGRYDYESSMALKGFTCAASVSDGRYIVFMGPGPMPVHRVLMEKMQKPIRKFFEQNLNHENKILYHAIILGDRNGITDALREPFNRTGLGHVLAVSGLHIGLVAWAAFFLFKWALSRSYTLPLKIDIRKPAAILTFLPVLIYVFIAGFQIPGQRALIMVLTFLLSLILGREKEVWSTLALAGLVILAIDPHALFSMSFQLSFTAVIGILWLTPTILNMMPLPDMSAQKTLLTRLYVYFIGLSAVCLSATIFLMPLTVAFFHRITLVTIPANIMVVPILGMWVIPLGLISVILLPFSTVAAGLVLQLGACGLDIMMGITRFWSNLSMSSIWMVTPNLFEALMFYALLFFVFHFKGRMGARIGTLAVLVLIMTDMGYWISQKRFNDELKVTFIDVGQANAALVEFPHGKRMMIDGGGFPRDRFDVGKMVVAPFLWYSKILTIDYVVLTHPQSDHMNGLRFIAKAFDPKEFWYNGNQVETASFKELMAIVRDKKIEKLLPAQLAPGRQINGATVEILHPGPVYNSLRTFESSKALNNNSLVLKISYQGKSFLFPGDLEKAGEDMLISTAGDRLKSHVLLSPHHGSGNSSTMAFLNRVQPRTCVISSGQGNFFGFPHPKTLERLRTIKCNVIRIDQSGAVRFVVDKNQLKVTTFLDADSLNR